MLDQAPRHRLRTSSRALLALFLSLVPHIILTASGGGQKFAVLPPVENVSVAQLHELIRGDSGNVVLVNIWATWCKPCIEELPRIARLSREYSQKPLRIILVSADEPELASSAVKQALTDAGVVTQTYLITGSGDEYFINSMSPKWSGALPTTFLYDRNGSLSDMLTGKQTYEKFTRAIDRLLVH